MPSLGRFSSFTVGNIRLWQFVALGTFVLLLGCGPNAAPPKKAPAKAISGPVEPAPAEKSNVEDGAKSAIANASATGPQLYVQHCAACHGERGDGQGLASPYLFPKPRNFRLGKFKLVSTGNLAPSSADLENVLHRGMPGSSMPPWPKLSDEERKLLIAHVINLYRSGMRDDYIARAKEEEDEEPSEARITEFLNRRCTPEPAPALPAFPKTTDEVVARGKELYVKQGCHSCHGKEGKGDGVQAMFDDDKTPTRPRDFTVGVFKGGHDEASLYRRIAIGMPGTPMPSSPNLTADQIIEMIQFIRSLSDEGIRQSVVLNREKLVARRVASVSLDLNAPVWEYVKPATIRSTPLWWRDGASPNLQVAAAHDGQSLAVRLVWNDTQADRHAGKTESFRDAAAIEFSSGGEPFIGMGAKGSILDLWLWDADRAAPAQLEEVNPRIVVDVYPFGEKVTESPEYDRDGTKTASQADFSLPAKAVGNQIARTQAHPSGASSLSAAGPGSVTFRPRENQEVKARGEWKEGKWTVVFLRPLKSDEGVTLAPDAHVSAAFALWDGAHRDRGPQKQISIWQDVVLEGNP